MQIIKEEINKTNRVISTPSENTHTLCLNDYLIKDNQDCLVIYHALVEGFEECERAVQPHVNVFSLFFHHLMRILTGYILKNNELLGPYKPSKEVLDFPVNRFPYINYMEILNNVDYESKDYSLVKDDNPYIKRKLISFLSRSLKPFGKGSIGISENTLFNRDLVLGLIRNGYQVQFLHDFKISVDYLDIQLKLISECINKIFINLCIANSPEPVIEIIKRHIINSVAENNNIRIDCDAIIAGSMCELINCSYGAISRLSGIPIISIMHGEGDQLLFNEPVFGYGDRTYPSVLFGFGPGPLEGIKDGKYLRSLYDQPEYMTSNSNFIKRIYNNDNVVPIKNHAKMKWMYIPDSITYHIRYGPFAGNIPPQLYLQWQRTLLNSFDNIIYKRHPKGHSLFRKLTNNNLKNLLVPHSNDILFTSENFYNIYEQCDGYIFDHISTAFMVASATDKPIVYFNLGKRNFTDYAEKIIRERCLWLDVDPANPGDLREQIESKQNKPYTNSITTNFSLDDSNPHLSREHKLLNTIKSIV